MQTLENISPNSAEFSGDLSAGRDGFGAAFRPAGHPREAVSLFGATIMGEMRPRLPEIFHHVYLITAINASTTFAVKTDDVISLG